MSTSQFSFQSRWLYHPRYWPTWLGLGLLWLTVQLPYPVLMWLGRIFGIVIWALDADRRRITRTNLRLCFPELDSRALRRLMLQNYFSTGMAIFEAALAWWASNKRLSSLYHVQGIEHYQQAMSQGKGVLLLGGHYATLEIGGRVMRSVTDKFRPSYKPARNPVFNWMMQNMRIKAYGGLVNSNNMRDVLRTFKNNLSLWYAPDQDFGMHSSVFAPFMGVPAATLTLTARLAKSAGATVLPWYCERLPNHRGYLVTFEPAIQNFPTGNDETDATIVNAVIEKHVRHVPEQYLWGHRRFKTRPIGEPMVYPSRRDWRLRRYTQFNVLLAIPYLAYSAWLSYRNRNPELLRQRLAVYSLPCKPADIWIHASSVGEVMAVMPLIENLHQRYPDKHIVLTTYTPTGGKTAQARLPAGVTHRYLPIDWMWCVKRFIAHIQPRCALFFETELWPNLHEYLYNRAIPVFIINGRISARTFKSPEWLLQLACRTAQYARYVLARSEHDYQQFLQMDVRKENMHVVGNIKFAIAQSAPAVPIDLDRPYILAASTHADEELQLAQLWLNTGITSHLLVIVPRHIHRTPVILKQLKQIHARVAVRSHKRPLAAQTQIYLADTFGELRGFIAGADFVIMGGSFVEAGGHNILEVGALRKAVVFGPHMDNFLAERDLYLAANAAQQVTDLQQLREVIGHWINSPQTVRDIGEHAYALMQSQKNVLDEYVNVIDGLLHKHVKGF